MTTRSKITWVVLGVMVGIALLVFTRWMTWRSYNWFFWLEVAFTALAILSLMIHGRAEIFKIVWLGKAERCEADSSKRRTRSKRRRSLPAPDSVKAPVKAPVNTQITADLQNGERIQQ